MLLTIFENFYKTDHHLSIKLNNFARTYTKVQSKDVKKNKTFALRIDCIFLVRSKHVQYMSRGFSHTYLSRSILRDQLYKAIDTQGSQGTPILLSRRYCWPGVIAFVFEYLLRSLVCVIEWTVPSILLDLFFLCE